MVTPRRDQKWGTPHSTAFLNRNCRSRRFNVYHCVPWKLLVTLALRPVQLERRAWSWHTNFGESTAVFGGMNPALGSRHSGRHQTNYLVIASSSCCWRAAFSLGCFRGGTKPPIVQIYAPLSVFQRLLHPHKNDGMQSQSVFNNNY